MNYKITNITNTLNKRDINYNTNVSFSVYNGLIKKTVTVKPEESVILTLNGTLPIDLQKYRVLQYIIIEETNILPKNDGAIVKKDSKKFKKK